VKIRKIEKVRFNRPITDSMNSRNNCSAKRKWIERRDVQADRDGASNANRLGVSLLGMFPPLDPFHTQRRSHGNSAAEQAFRWFYSPRFRVRL